MTGPHIALTSIIAFVISQSDPKVVWLVETLRTRLSSVIFRCPRVRRRPT